MKKIIFIIPFVSLLAVLFVVGTVNVRAAVNNRRAESIVADLKGCVLQDDPVYENGRYDWINDTYVYPDWNAEYQLYSNEYIAAMAAVLCTRNDVSLVDANNQAEYLDGYEIRQGETVPMISTYYPAPPNEPETSPWYYPAGYEVYHNLNYVYHPAHDLDTLVNAISQELFREDASAETLQKAREIYNTL